MNVYLNENSKRLKIIQATIIKNIREINKYNPNYNVGLLIFGNEIYYYGNGENKIINELYDVVN